MKYLLQYLVSGYEFQTHIFVAASGTKFGQMVRVSDEISSMKNLVQTSVRLYKFRTNIFDEGSCTKFGQLVRVLDKNVR